MKKIIKSLTIATLIIGISHTGDALSQSLDEIQYAIQIGTVTTDDLVTKLANKNEYPVKIVVKSGKTYQGVVISNAIENGQFRMALENGEVTSIDASSIESISVPSNLKYLSILRPMEIPHNTEAPTQLVTKRKIEDVFGKRNLTAKYEDRDLDSTCRASLNKLLPQLETSFINVEKDAEGKKALSNFKGVTLIAKTADLKVSKTGDKIEISYSCGHYSVDKEVEKAVMGIL